MSPQRGREGGHKIEKMGLHCLWMAPYVTEKLRVEETNFLGTLTFDTLDVLTFDSLILNTLTLDTHDF